MTRKDFVLIADCIRDLKSCFKPDAIEKITRVFTEQLRNHFPRFNSEKFKRYILKEKPQ